MNSETDSFPIRRPKSWGVYFSADAEGGLGSEAFGFCWVVVPGTGALADLGEDFAFA